MNENAASPEITFDGQANAAEVPDEKPADAGVPGYEAEFDSDGAERAGDALNGQDAAEGGTDLVEEPVFIEDVDPECMVIPLLINRTTARELPGESLDDALDRLARERQGE